MARTINPTAFRLGNPDYFGPDIDIGLYSAAQRVALKDADAIIAQHIEPLRTENETLRAERDAAIASAEEQAKRIAQMERWLGLTGDPALRPTIEASHELGAQFDDRFRARVRENFGLTTPEPPHGD